MRHAVVAVLCMLFLPVVEAQSSCARPLRTAFPVAEPSFRLQEAQTPDFRFLQYTAKRLGCEISVVPAPVSFARRQRMLAEGEIDVLTLASVREDRLAFAYFSDAYRAETYRIYVRPDSPWKQLDWATLFNTEHTIIAPAGGWFGNKWQQAIPLLIEQHRLQPYHSINQGLRQLYASPPRGEWFMADELILPYVVRGSGFPMPRPLDFVINSESSHLMFSKRSVPAELVQQFNRQIAMNRNFFESERFLAVSPY
ncbi:substrate-binding periplasmic protein [Permianibacter aggregans]|uniref:Extracellular solute-binding protein (Family 3) n=1 Tax=Permianibacter aggregans TaxID=1510150 RepID=A0A4R6UUF8_9GAMM|nr:transporter substrate-binding domain-containing protein [Permianibacter aggregans]QGX40336.1 transporter substrate-binding domain-containing protein [Permianibacter aggregans]TDQ49539.1 extracellular solute-binding protein (family 3) [Permianibacter aggregans]